MEGKYPTTDQLVLRIKEAENFSGNKWNLPSILKVMGFKYQKTNNGRKLLMMRSNIVSVMNQNCARSVCWKMSDRTVGLRLETGKFWVKATSLSCFKADQQK